MLNVLSGRSTPSPTTTITGHISVSGQLINPVTYRKNIAYVMQENALLATSTPREALQFSARLRLPCDTADSLIDELVDVIIEDLGLEECADTMIGGSLIKGISGGEMKRTAIGIELITNPSVSSITSRRRRRRSGSRSCCCCSCDRRRRNCCSLLLSTAVTVNLIQLYLSIYLCLSIYLSISILLYLVVVPRRAHLRPRRLQRLQVCRASQESSVSQHSCPMHHPPAILGSVRPIRLSDLHGEGTYPLSGPC